MVFIIRVKIAAISSGFLVASCDILVLKPKTGLFM